MGAGADVGQSFINDPTAPTGTGTGATINLNTWTFAFFNTVSQTTAAAATLTIFSGTGNGGTVVGTAPSANASTLTFATFPAVTWTFTGGLAIIDNQTYTAVLVPRLSYRLNSTPSVYPNGTVTQGSSPLSLDAVFEGTFSTATPAPFEFSPALGLGVLGGLFALKKLAKKKKAS